MQTLRTRTSRIVAGGVLAAALALGGASAALAQGHVGPSGSMPFAVGASGTASSGQTSTYGPGFGMMGGQRYGPGAGNVPSQAGYGPGGMMGGSGIGPGGMMGGWSGGAPTGPAISLAQAQQDVQAYLDRLGNADLRVDEVMEFQDNFYAIVKEHSTGIGAFEVLINKTTGAVMREPGPDMLWNTKYGMLGQNSWMGDRRDSGCRSPQARGADRPVVVDVQAVPIAADDAGREHDVGDHSLDERSPLTSAAPFR